MKFIRTMAVALLGLGVIAAPIISTSAQAQGVQVFELQPYDTVKQDLQTAVDDFMAYINSPDGQKLVSELEDSFAGIEKVKSDYVALPTKDEAALDAAAQAWLDAFENMQDKLYALVAHAPLEGITEILYLLNYYPLDFQSDRASIEAILAPVNAEDTAFQKSLSIQSTTYQGAAPYVEELMAPGEQLNNDLAVKGMLMHFKAELTEAAGN